MDYTRQDDPDYWRDKYIKATDELNEEVRKKSARIRELEGAANKMVHLHMCEQEGLSSGQPSPEEWVEAVDALSEALKEQSDGSVIRREVE